MPSFSCWDWAQNWRDFVGHEFGPDPVESMVSLAPSPFCSVPTVPTYKAGSPQWPLTMSPIAFSLDMPFYREPSLGLRAGGDWRFCLHDSERGGVRPNGVGRGSAPRESEAQGSCTQASLIHLCTLAQ